MGMFSVFDVGCVFQLGLAAENAALQEDKGRLVCVFVLCWC